MEDSSIYYNKQEANLQTFEEIRDEMNGLTSQSQRNQLALIYILFLAEAIMAASLSSQIALLETSPTQCLAQGTTFLRNILECAYLFGSTAGVSWGWLSDRDGRRVVALSGLLAMSLCCVCMSWVNTLSTAMFLRGVAGICSSAVTVPALAMLADVSVGRAEKIKNLSRLPLVVVFGSIGRVFQGAFEMLNVGAWTEFREQWFPLDDQLVYAGLVFTIFVVELIQLDETLVPLIRQPTTLHVDADCEKGALLAEHTESKDSTPSGVYIVESEESGPAGTPMTIDSLLAAPSFVKLFVAYSLLQIHTSLFGVLLPHLGHTPLSHHGLWFSNEQLDIVSLLVQGLSAVTIFYYLPRYLHKISTLSALQYIACYFPALYTVLPLGVVLTSVTCAGLSSSAFIELLGAFCQHVLAGSGQVVLYILLLSMAPNAESTGITIGFASFSCLLKAWAVGLGGVIYFLSNDYSTVIVNGASWTVLTIFALAGVLVSGQVQDGALVGSDIPVESLAWKSLFDVDDDLGGEI